MGSDRKSNGRREGSEDQDRQRVHEGGGEVTTPFGANFSLLIFRPGSIAEEEDGHASSAHTRPIEFLLLKCLLSAFPFPQKARRREGAHCRAWRLLSIRGVQASASQQLRPISVGVW